MILANMLFTEPELDDRDLEVVAELDEFRLRLRHWLRHAKRWKGQLRRNLKARAIRGSNSIEGYDVSLDDAVAILEDDEPLDADKRTSLEIIGYRNALTYIQGLAGDPDFSFDESLLRSLHFMMLGHDLSNSPGLYRKKSIYVHDEERDITVYEGPDFEIVPGLVRDLIEQLAVDSESPVFVRAAMAHLNLVMIHPFRDGNGRMARALQTLVLARAKIVAPEFSSIEEWLGRNTNLYYDVLAITGGGKWNPHRDTTSWIKFNLMAHHMQAQTVLRRVAEANQMWNRIDEIVADKHLPERAGYAIFDAMIGLKVRRSSYERDAKLESPTASRDLRMLVAANLLNAVGETKARYYVATDELRSARKEIGANRMRPTNPYNNDEPDQGLRRNVFTVE